MLPLPLKQLQNPSLTLPSSMFRACLTYTKESQLGFQGKPSSRCPIAPSRLALPKGRPVFSTLTVLLYKYLLIIVKFDAVQTDNY